MRRALLAVVLIAASFGGGAFVNGPGMRWAQTNLMSKFGMEGDEDSPSQTPPSIAEADDTPNGSIPPLTKEPSLVSVSSKTTQSNAGKSVEKPVKPSRYVDTKLPKPKPLRETAAAAVAEDRSRQSAALKPADASAPGDPPSPLPSPLDSEENEPDTSISLASLGESPKPLALNDAKINDVPPAEPSAGASDGAAIPVSPTSWSEVRQTLKSLGVTRYGTEGNTAGRVRFYCLIPLAGRKAVGQHFEAEGDDELEAAQATIRRIGLWRATAINEAKSISAP